jgi:type I restriction enzyme S subunit
VLRLIGHVRSVRGVHPRTRQRQRQWRQGQGRYLDLRPGIELHHLAACRTDTDYAYYLTKSEEVRGYSISQMTGTSGRQRVPTEALDHLLVLVPPLSEQRAIAHILGTLDDKIELNRRMNETLEAMARALFKSWFVDFDPVRANAEGRDPGLPKRLADHLTDRVADSELGEIPEVWEVQTMSEHVDAVKGVSYKGSGLADSGMPLHNLNSVYEGGGYKYEGIKYYNGEFAERHIVHPGDVIVANTEQGHDRLLIGYAAVVPRVFGEAGIASHHIYRLRPKHQSPLTAAYLCHLLNSPQMHDRVSGYANGTTVNMLPIDGVQKPKFILPPTPLVQAFDKLATQDESRREELVVESGTLATLRDALLHKLISGEIRVKNAERFVEEYGL